MDCSDTKRKVGKLVQKNNIIVKGKKNRPPPSTNNNKSQIGLMAKAPGYKMGGCGF